MGRIFFVSVNAWRIPFSGAQPALDDAIALRPRLRSARRWIRMKLISLIGLFVGVAPGRPYAYHEKNGYGNETWAEGNDAERAKNGDWKYNETAKRAQHQPKGLAYIFGRLPAEVVHRRK